MRHPPQYTLQANTDKISNCKLQQTGNPTDRQSNNLVKSHKIHSSEVIPTLITGTREQSHE